MTTIDEPHQVLAAAQLTGLADVLDTQPEAARDGATLCEGWTVRHVVAHLTMAARYDEAGFGREIAAARGDFGVVSETIARRDAELPWPELMAQLRGDVMASWTPPGPPGAPNHAGALTHAVIHSLDIALPAGLDDVVAPEAATAVLDLLAGGVALRFGVDPAGRRLVATDVDWSSGDGAVVEATAGELIVALAARPRPGVDLGHG